MSHGRADKRGLTNKETVVGMYFDSARRCPILSSSLPIPSVVAIIHQLRLHLYALQVEPSSPHVHYSEIVPTIYSLPTASYRSPIVRGRLINSSLR
jgi:hypothetical protein